VTATIERLPESETLLAEMGDALDPARYDWASATAQPLTAEETFQLTYAAQVEWGTEGTFESLNISEDPVVRRFLPIWLERRSCMPTCWRGSSPPAECTSILCTEHPVSGARAGGDGG